MIVKLYMDAKEKKKSRLLWVQDNYPLLEPEITHLDYGDYHYVSDHGDRVVFEYKTGKDFLSSIRNNHLQNQVYEMATHYDHQFVIVNVASWNKLFKEMWYKLHQDWSMSEVMGAIASLNRYSTVLVMSSMAECFEMMYRQAVKIDDDRMLSPRHPKKSKNPAVNYLMGIHGLNNKTVKNIYIQYKPRTLQDLLDLTHEDLVSIDGIGSKKAEMILAGIKGEV